MRRDARDQPAAPGGLGDHLVEAHLQLPAVEVLLSLAGRYGGVPAGSHAFDTAPAAAACRISALGPGAAADTLLEGGQAVDRLQVGSIGLIDRHAGLVERPFGFDRVHRVQDG
ncbi:hypothetical protein D3C87_1144700 [compost metagenome]